MADFQTPISLVRGGATANETVSAGGQADAADDEFGEMLYAQVDPQEKGPVKEQEQVMDSLDDGVKPAALSETREESPSKKSTKETGFSELAEELMASEESAVPEVDPALRTQHPEQSQAICETAQEYCSSKVKGELEAALVAAANLAQQSAEESKVVVLHQEQVAAEELATADAAKTLPFEGQAEILPLINAQAERVLNPLKRREASPEELVLAALGERDEIKVQPMAQRAGHELQLVDSLNLVNERVMKVEELSSRFGEQVLSMVQQSEKVMKITVQPAALGTLTVMVREHDQQMSVEIHSQNEAVRELVARQEDSIRRLMQDHNIDLAKFDVLLKDRPESQARQQFGAEPRENRANGTSGIAPASEEHVKPKDSPGVLNNGATSWVA